MFSASFERSSKFYFVTGPRVRRYGSILSICQVLWKIVILLHMDSSIKKNVPMAVNIFEMKKNKMDEYAFNETSLAFFC